MKLEGIVSKRRDAPYRSGRSDAFVKCKCSDAQEFVIGGYVPSTVMPRAIGSLVVGYYGKAAASSMPGTSAPAIRRRPRRTFGSGCIRSRSRPPPFDGYPAKERRRRDVHWVKPAARDRSAVSAAGRRTSCCGRRRSRACARTSRHRRWSAKCLLPSATVRRHHRRASQLRSLAERSKGNDQEIGSASAKSPARGAKSARPARSRRPERGRKAISASPIRTGSIGRMSASPSRIWPITTCGVGLDGAASGRTAARARALPGRDQGECFFQKHASAGLDRTAPQDRDRQQEATDHRGREPRRPALARAGGRARSARARLHDRSARPVRSHRLRPRSRARASPGRLSSRRRATCASGWTRLTLKASSSFRAAKVCTSSCRSSATDWETTKTFVQAFAQAMAADDPDRYVAKMTKSHARRERYSSTICAIRWSRPRLQPIPRAPAPARRSRCR